MRVLVRIAGELKAYEISAIYNLETMDEGAFYQSNSLIMECLDGDNTALIVPVDKDDGEDIINQIAEDGYLSLCDRSDIRVETDRLECNHRAYNNDKLAFYRIEEDTYNGDDLEDEGYIIEEGCLLEDSFDEGGIKWE